MAKEKFDAYQAVTDKLIARLEELQAKAERGEPVPSWISPYSFNGGGLPVSISTGKPYRGINPMLLGMEAADRGYVSRYWGTYKKISELGGQVRRGEKGTLITFWRRIEKVDEETGEPKPIFLLRVYNVFNAEQADWPDGPRGAKLAAKFFTPPAPLPDDGDTSPFDAVLSGYKTAPQVVSQRQDLAFYAPARDTVNVPKRENIAGRDEYYSTLYHELVHSTGHAKRLNRDGITKLEPHRRGELYSFEELVAEFGAALLCSTVGITSTLPNSAAYLAHWGQYLRHEPRAAVKAASQAQRAVDYILGIDWTEGSADAGD